MRTTSLATLARCGYGLFVAVPLLTLAYMAITILYLAVDIPAWDDWRQYQQGKAGAFDLAYLFRPANDTLYPVGKMLDSAAVQALAGNAVAYKFLSMTAVLGSLLWLQWRLLRSALNDRFLVACCFAATMFMLCPDTYWDFQYMAFHQAVPLVCILTSLVVIVAMPAHDRLEDGFAVRPGIDRRPDLHFRSGRDQRPWPVRCCCSDFVGRKTGGSTFPQPFPSARRV